MCCKKAENVAPHFLHRTSIFASGWLMAHQYISPMGIFFVDGNPESKSAKKLADPMPNGRMPIKWSETFVAAGRIS
jgi:hypothetical protein